MRDEHRELSYGFNAAMHAPEHLDQMFPPPGATSGSMGFVDDDWYEPVYGAPPEVEQPQA